MTVNVRGNVVKQAKAAGYHAYYANGVTAVEVKTYDESKARMIAEQFGKVLYMFT